MSFAPPLNVPVHNNVNLRHFVILPPEEESKHSNMSKMRPNAMYL